MSSRNGRTPGVEYEALRLSSDELDELVTYFIGRRRNPPTYPTPPQIFYRDGAPSLIRERKGDENGVVLFVDCELTPGGHPSAWFLVHPVGYFDAGDSPLPIRPAPRPRGVRS